MSQPTANGPAWPTLDDVERAHVIATCGHCDWDLPRVAGLLRVSLKTVYNLLHRYAAEGRLDWSAGRNFGKAVTA